MERISIFEFTGEQNADEQVGRAVSDLLSECGLLLPDFVHRQIEESILRAISEDSSSQHEFLSAGKIVQLGIHTNSTAESSRWGFFLVQKRGDPGDAARLFLDLYLYQE
jgi:hypothetical protein